MTSTNFETDVTDSLSQQQSWEKRYRLLDTHVPLSPGMLLEATVAGENF